MVIVKIGGVDYSVVSGWKDITIEQAVKVAELKFPEKLKEIYDVFYKGTMPPEEKEKKITELENRISDDDYHKFFPRFYLSVIELLSDIPHDVALKIDVISVRALYSQYLKDIVEGCIYLPVGFDQNPIAFFDFDGVRYLLPQDKEIFGKPVPMINISALEFCQSADMMAAAAGVQKDLSKLSMLMATLCRPEGEAEYDQDVAIERAKKFEKLPMDVVWKVFFSLIVPFNLGLQLSAISSLQQEVRETREPGTFRPLDGTVKSYSWQKAWKALKKSRR